MKKIKGDLLDLAEAGEFNIIVQGCNCFCTQKSGLAGQIAKRYPQAVAADNETRCGDLMKLGTYTLASVTTKAGGFVIINAYTQYGTNKKEEFQDLFEYTSFQLILEKLARLTGVKINFGFPLIGCGLAGGDEVRILKMIEDFSLVVEEQGSTVTVVEWSK